MKGFRKLGFCLIIFLTTTGLLIWAHIPPEIYATITTSIIWGYIAGNVGVAAADKAPAVANAWSKKSPEAVEHLNAQEATVING